jgi:hypothetical protein
VLEIAKGQPKDTETMIIFDDVLNEKNQDKIKDYYTLGRKNGCTSIYLGQRFTQVPLVVRAQADIVILLKVASVLEVKRICSNFSLGISVDELVRLYRDATSERMHFLKMDCTTGDQSKRFSKDWLDYYDIGGESGEKAS